MAQSPQRNLNHIIDSKACVAVSQKFSTETWVLRDLTERDFGVDKIAERFEDSFATSELLMLQIKGTEKEIDNKNPRFSLDTKTLIYAEMFSVPFLLVYCSINAPHMCYYLWLQEYIRVRLNYENPGWRSQTTNTVYFPSDNVLGTERAEKHLAYIAQFPKYKASWVSYYLCLCDLCDSLPGMFIYENMSKEEINEMISSTIPKLENAAKKIGHIPRRFVPRFYESTIRLGKEILEAEGMPTPEVFTEYIGNCQMIQTSMENIALRFDDDHIRFLYEIEGIADY